MTSTATGQASPAAADRSSAPSRWRPRGLGPRLAGAAVSGALVALALPPYDVWLLAPLGVAGLVLLCRGQSARRGALLGLVHGLATFVPLLSWLTVIGPDAWLAVALLEASFLALAGAVHAGRAAAAGLAAVGGLPLGGPGAGPRLDAVRRLPVGPAGVRRDRVTVHAVRRGGRCPAGDLRDRAVRCAARGRRPAGAGRLAPAPSPLALLAVAVPLAGLVLPVGAGEGRPVTVALVQGDVPGVGLDFQGEREQVLRNHVDATHRLAADVRAGDVAQPGPGDLAGERLGHRPVPRPVGRRPDRRRRCGTSASRCWSARCCRGRARTTSATPASSGTRRPAPGSATSSGTRCRSASTSRSATQLTGLISRLDQIPRDFYAGRPARQPHRRPGRGGRRHLLRGRLRRAGPRRGPRRCRGPGGADEQRHLQRHRAAVPADGDVPAARRRDRPGRAGDRDQRHQRRGPRRRLGRGPGAGEGRADAGRRGAAARRADPGDPARRLAGVAAGRRCAWWRSASPCCAGAAARRRAGRATGERRGRRTAGCRPRSPAAPGVLVVVPTYQERLNVEDVVRAAARGRAAGARAGGRRQQPGRHRGARRRRSPPPTRRCTCCTGRPRRGSGLAYLAGFGWGLERGYDVLVEMDADGSHQPEQLPALLAALPGADLVLGSRWVPGRIGGELAGAAPAALPGRQPLRPAGAGDRPAGRDRRVPRLPAYHPGEARPGRRREPRLLLPGGPRLAHRAGRASGWSRCRSSSSSGCGASPR